MADLSTGQKIGRALSGLSAGIQGNGPQYLAGIQSQDAYADQQAQQKQAQQQQMTVDRQKAMVKDAITLNNLLNNGQVEQGLQLVNNRIGYISQLGGDPKDTMQVKMLLESGDVDGAQSLVRGLLTQAQSMGLMPEAEQVNPNSLVDGRYRVTHDPITGQMSASDVYAQTGMPPSAEKGPNMGLSPVWLQNEQGQYVPGQLSSSGGISVAQLPEGMRALPGAGQMAFDPGLIAQRGGAETQVQVDRTQALTPAEAQQAGAVEAATQQAQTQAIMPKAEAQREADLVTSSGKRSSALQSKEDQVGMLTDLVDVAKGQSNNWTTGFIGSAMSKVPGSKAYDLGRTLDTLQASAGFETLQEMRDNSPTGGALGQVTERELALLQATWGSLQQSQSKEQFEANLDRFQRQLENSWNRVNNAYQKDYGQPYFEESVTTISPTAENDPLGIL